MNVQNVTFGHLLDSVLGVVALAAHAVQQDVPLVGVVRRVLGLGRRQREVHGVAVVPRRRRRRRARARLARAAPAHACNCYSLDSLDHHHQRSLSTCSFYECGWKIINSGNHYECISYS